MGRTVCQSRVTLQSFQSRILREGKFLNIDRSLFPADNNLVEDPQETPEVLAREWRQSSHLLAQCQAFEDASTFIPAYEL
jgi:hypothetical protein